jgi:hypothetical protein
LTASALLAECSRRSIALSVVPGPAGPRLRATAVVPPPPNVVEYLERHKAVLIELLGARVREGRREKLWEPPHPELPAASTEQDALRRPSRPSSFFPEDGKALAATIVEEECDQSDDPWGAGRADVDLPLVWTRERAGQELLWFVFAASAPGIQGGGVTRRDALADLTATAGVHPDATEEQVAEVTAAVAAALAGLAAQAPSD